MESFLLLVGFILATTSIRVLIKKFASPPPPKKKSWRFKQLRKFIFHTGKESNWYIKNFNIVARARSLKLNRRDINFIKNKTFVKLHLHIIVIRENVQTNLLHLLQRDSHNFYSWIISAFIQTAIQESPFPKIEKSIKFKLLKLSANRCNKVQTKKFVVNLRWGFE